MYSMSYELIMLIGFLEGIITGIMLRFEITSKIAWILNVSTIIGFLIISMQFLTEPSIDGLYSFIYFSIPFIISMAFAARGEDMVNSLIRK